MKELQNLMSIGDVAKSFGVCVATVESPRSASSKSELRSNVQVCIASR